MVEDNKEIIEAVSLCFELRWPGAIISSASEGERGLEVLEAESPDIVILDLGLPDLDGFDVLRQVRAFSDVPIIILTVRGEEINKVKGLELGADDYIVKPFAPAELLARVKAVLRRSQMPELRGDEKPIVTPKLSINLATREIIREGRIVKLSPTEFNLLYQLVRNQGKVLSHQMLLEKVWGSDYVGATEYLKVYIQRLREKLEEEPSSPRMFISERGLGYKFITPS
ncbi:MAG: response regulator transcription factor [Chloroflexota bacterium]|nr:response regulator transcription factor [Chloroflexota bacterium]